MTRRHLWTLLLLTAVTVAVFGQCLGHQFLNWDDQDYVTRNPVVQELSTGHLRAAFSSYFVGNYAPLQILSYMLDHALWGLRPAGFLLTNLVCHLAAGILFYLLALRISGRMLVALPAALIFLVHPVQVESVAWISQRKNLLAMVFFLVAWHAYLGFRENGAGARRWWCYAGSLLAFLLACLAKSVAVILLPALVLYDLLVRRDYLRASLHPHKLPYLAIAAITAWLALLSQDPAEGGGRTVYHGGSPLATALTMAPVMVRYLGMLVWPADLSAVYYPPVRTTVDAAVVLSLLVLLAILAAVVLLCRRGRQSLAFWILLFFVGLLPVSQIVPLVTLMNDRYLYFPMLGAAMTAALLPVAVYDRRQRAAARTGLACLAGLLLAAMGTAAFLRTRVWHDSITLWSDAYRKNPPIAQTAHFLGRAYRDAGDYRLALPFFRQALDFLPNDPLLILNCADAHLRLQQPDAARELIIRMRPLFPANDLRVLWMQGEYALNTGDLSRAEVFFLEALRREPGHPDCLFRLGRVYALMDRLSDARGALLAALKNGNREADVYFALACVETERGALDEARQALRAAAERGRPGILRLREDERLGPLRDSLEYRQLFAGG